MSPETTRDTARKAIFITGAASGIGRATARLFAGEGWFVGCFDRNDGALEALKAEIGEARGRFQQLDVTDHAGFKLALDAFGAASGGRMDVLHNNAGIIAEGAFGDMPWDAVMGIVNVNLVAVMFGIHAALPLLKATPGSLCFTTCSASAIFGSANLVGYSASKGAVKAATEALAIELHRHGVRSADVLPGIVDTAMLTPEMKAVLPPDGPWRLVQPVEVAEVVWRAYGEDRIHWYVPEELKPLHVQAIQAPEQTRDYFLALGRG